MFNIVTLQLQGFLESEDTTAPLVRYASRTSQGRLSSSQPALSSNSTRSSLPRPGNVTVDLDYDTPRTLLQRYVLNSKCTCHCRYNTRVKANI